MAAVPHCGRYRRVGFWFDTVACSEWQRKAATQGIALTNRSETRRQLENSLRALVPVESIADLPSNGDGANIAVAGVGGLLTGYLWGRLKRRQRRTHKSRS